MHLVTIIDTGISNITSVINAFERIGCEVKVTNLKDDIVFAKFLVLPGVGSFEHGMRALQKYDLIDCQIMNPHLKSLGAYTISRKEFIIKLEANLNKSTNHNKWIL